ncbi:MAG: UxaA family hydrolase [Rhodothermales bacterium]
MIPFEKIGRLPVPDDNVAIATKKLDAGSTIVFKEQQFSLSHTILEGHRFAIQPIAQGALLNSWGMAFGTAIKDIAPGAYVSNVGLLEALRGRRIDFDLPESPNFTDEIPDFSFDSDGFRPAEQVPRADDILYFEGFDRGKERGVGTRNFIAVIGVSSRAAGFARRLSDTCDTETAAYVNIDGVVPIAHTEGDDAVQHNKTLVLRTLAGFLTHPNIGAALIVDHARASVTNADLKTFLESAGYALDQVPHHFMSLHGAYADHLTEGRQVIQEWYTELNKTARTKQPLSNLKIALQCGGSDAFSGISGNPLAGWVAKAVIEQGGGANLAETDELIGAESYVLKKVKSESVARRFLHVVDRFQKRAALHGSSAAGNPSGGNKFRGLYNIYLKSLGAAMKRHPDVRLDHVIEYGEPMKEPGYYFMDSPGNDLESIAGQVASGCNVIFFVTGNGSITNFPFVPTIKIVTTSRRYELLEADMDVNAGAYLDGVGMDDLGTKMLGQTIDVASGRKSVGELAGHAQVQLWRNWRLQENNTLQEKETASRQFQRIEKEESASYSGEPISVEQRDGPDLSLGDLDVHAERVGLVLPTSLCSGQISNMAVARLNDSSVGEKLGVKQFVSLVHTEGCGASSGASEHLFLRTMCGYLSHPLVGRALLLEHGCEKTHNDYFRNYLESEDVDTTGFGWASIQQDGGIEKVLEKIDDWFAHQAGKSGEENKDKDEARAPAVGVIITGKASRQLIKHLCLLAQAVLRENGSVVIPTVSDDDLHADFLTELGVSSEAGPTLHYAQRIQRPGFHIMAAPTTHVQELISGMGAAGVEILVVVSNDFAVPAHPFIPTIQIGDTSGVDLDWCAVEDEDASNSLMEVLVQAWTGQYKPVNRTHEYQDFQISRGWTGISL